MGTKGCWSGNKPKFTENNNLPFDADGNTFQRTFGLPHANIQHHARGLEAMFPEHWEHGTGMWNAEHHFIKPMGM
jgi:hypothetical protein